jgi:hypothetical protein
MIIIFRNMAAVGNIEVGETLQSSVVGSWDFA